MRIWRSILTFALAAASCFATDLEDAWHVLRPVIHAKDEQKTASMRSAPLVMLAAIEAVEVFDEPREVEKPPEVGGPMLPTIQLYLARISAKPLLLIAGTATGPVQFYSWVWASGMHGGSRLFNPTPESVHVLFLTRDSGYLRTVGDYPAYDVELRLKFVQRFVANWQAGYLKGADLLEQIAAVRLKAELESLDESEATKYWLNTPELAILTTREFVTTQLGNLCTNLTNPGGRAKACAEYAEWVNQ